MTADYVAESAETLAEVLWLHVCHGDPTWRFDGLPEYIRNKHLAQAHVLLTSDWMKRHDAEVRAADECDARRARVNAIADEWERKADAIAITYQDADQRARATGWLRTAARDLRAALAEEGGR